MIDPKELRIGNFVAWGVNCVTIQGIHQDTVLKETKEPHVYVDGVGRMHYFPLSVSEINPIPITPEWFERLDFTPYPFNGGWRHDSMWLEIDNMGDYFQYQHGCAEIRYIHQLQNLYFALTGTELTVNP